jgi:hypothetical protein
MSSGDKTKLDGVALNANNYSHPTSDGNLHVPATGTTNNGRVLKAGATAGSLSWGSLTATDVGAVASNDSRLTDSRTPTDSSVTNAKVSATAAIADTKLATISTAGKVANSATTGSTLSNANTLVLRNANGATELRQLTFNDTSKNPAKTTQYNASQLKSLTWSPATIPVKILTGYYYDDPGFLAKEIEFNTSYSVSSVAIGNGGKSFSTQPGLASFYTVGSEVTIKFDETRQMYGAVSSYNNLSGALVCTIGGSIGSGTFSLWSIQSANGGPTFQNQVFNGDSLYMQKLSGGSTSGWYQINYDPVSFPNVFSTYTSETQIRSGTCQFAFFENLGISDVSVTAHPSTAGIYCVNLTNPDFPNSNSPTPYNPLINVIGGGITNLTANIVQSDWDAVGGYSTVFRVTTLSGTATTPYQVIFTAESGI